MRERCLSPASDAYKNYGGRGIKICERWSYFENFVSDMGDKPENMTLDRIETNGDYSPGNCKWSTKQEQARGRRKTRWFIIDGCRLCLVDVAEKYNIKRKTLEQRLKTGMPIEKAITTPIGNLYNKYTKKFRYG